MAAHSFEWYSAKKTCCQFSCLNIPCVPQLRKKTLEVSVWDYDKSSSNDFLGEVSSPDSPPWPRDTQNVVKHVNYP